MLGTFSRLLASLTMASLLRIPAALARPPLRYLRPFASLGSLAGGGGDVGGGGGGVPIESLRTPCYLLDWEVAQANAKAMLATAERMGCRLRPHVKTHKTVEVALLQTGGRREGITVSTLAEANFFHAAEWDDIL